MAKLARDSHQHLIAPQWRRGPGSVIAGVLNFSNRGEPGLLDILQQFLGLALKQGIGGRAREALRGKGATRHVGNSHVSIHRLRGTLHLVRHDERDVIAIAAFLLQHRSGHGNLLAGLVLTADIAGEISEGAVT